MLTHSHCRTCSSRHGVCDCTPRGTGSKSPRLVFQYFLSTLHIGDPTKQSYSGCTRGSPRVFPLTACWSACPLPSTAASRPYKRCCSPSSLPPRPPLPSLSQRLSLLLLLLLPLQPRRRHKAPKPKHLLIQSQLLLTLIVTLLSNASRRLTRHTPLHPRSPSLPPPLPPSHLPLHRAHAVWSCLRGT